MADPNALARTARMIRLTGALALLAAGGAIVLVFTGRSDRASALLGIALPLGGVALLAAAVLFHYARRLRRQQDPQ